MLQIENLKVAYGQSAVIDGLTLAVDSDELLVILGPSGCGKSTLLYAVAGLLKPGGGRIALGKETFFSAKEKVDVPAERRRVGFVFQDYSLWPHMSVFENIAYPLRVRKQRKPEIDKRVRGLLKAVNLSEKEREFPHRLSGGEKQRVALARAIAVDPVLLLLDEPLANIDAALKTQLLSLILRLKNSLGISAVYVTHDQKEAFEIASSIAVMDSGRILQRGSPKQIYEQPANRFVAEFVGENNLLSGEMLEGLPCERGKVLTARPEDIRITRDGRYCGRVERIVYRGSRSSLYVSVGNARLTIDAAHTGASVGGEIRFNIDKLHELNS